MSGYSYLECLTENIREVVCELMFGRGRIKERLFCALEKLAAVELDHTPPYGLEDFWPHFYEEFKAKGFLANGQVLAERVGQLSEDDAAAVAEEIAQFWHELNYEESVETFLAGKRHGRLDGAASTSEN